jgi:hypothetical protein
MELNMKFIKISTIVIFIILTNSCGPIADYRQLTERDIQPPLFIRMGTIDSKTLEIQLSEEVSSEITYSFIEPEIEISSYIVENDKIYLIFTADLVPGNVYKLEISINDISGNSLTILSEFYGYNSNLPELAINEFTCQGSTTNPDKVELRVLTNGNTAGICIYEGVDIEWAQRKVLPSINVSENDYIIIHFKPSGTDEEVDETDSMDISGGLNVHPEAWDIWLEGGTGLSGNNGTISLFTNPVGELMDAVLYSNRTSVSDDKYRGFGSTSTLIKADRLFELGAWTAEGELIAPEDAINPEDSTATRSICRESLFSDNNSSADWHIVPTSTASFGDLNSDEIFE